MSDLDSLTCYRHPKVETVLRCYQCERPICVKCARRTAVGYLCEDCLKGRKQRYEQARITDYVIAAVIALVLGGIAGMVVPTIGMILMVFVSPLAGTAIAEVVWRAVGRRYGSHLWWIVAAGIVLGTVPTILLRGLNVLVLITGDYGAEYYPVTALSLLWPVLHILLAGGAAIARLRLR